MNGSDAPPASMVNEITWSRYVTLDSLISSPVLAGGASEALMLPPCMCACNNFASYALENFKFNSYN